MSQTNTLSDRSLNLTHAICKSRVRSRTWFRSSFISDRLQGNIGRILRFDLIRFPKMIVAEGVPASPEEDNHDGTIRAIRIELAGRFAPLVRRFEDYGGILKVKLL